MTEEREIELKRYFDARLGVEDSFYRSFDSMVDDFNNALSGKCCVRVNNIEIEIVNGRKPIEEDDE